MSMNLVTLLYLFASVCFIQALKGLSHPTTSIRGNLFGMVGMAVAVVTTAALIVKIAGQTGQGGAMGMAWVLGALVVGGLIAAAAFSGDEGPNGWIAKGAGVAAVTLASVNIFGGFMVTRRMLEMFRKKEKKVSAKEGAQ